jgi:hypothetical protein
MSREVGVASLPAFALGHLRQLNSTFSYPKPELFVSWIHSPIGFTAAVFGLFLKLFYVHAN